LYNKSQLTFILIASTILAVFNPSLLHEILSPALAWESSPIAASIEDIEDNDDDDDLIKSLASAPQKPPSAYDANIM